MKDFINSLGKDGLKSAYSLLENFALYLTVALAIALLVAFIALKLSRKDKLAFFKTLSLGIVIGYAVTITACISFLMIARMQLKEELDANFFLMLGFFAVLLVYAVSAMITSIINKKAFKITNLLGAGISIVYGIVLLILIPTAGEEYEPLSDVGMYVFSALLIAIMALTAIFSKNQVASNQTKSVAFAGVTIALSFALSYVKLFSLPQGGSVTLASMLPLIIYAYVFGARKGLLAGVIYGVLQCLQNPQFYQPMQVLLDYPIAFGCIGLAGIVKNFNKVHNPSLKFVIGASIACVGRYVSHLISGYYVFSSWAMEGYTALSWSLVYNLYIIAELAIIVVVGALLFSSKAFNKEIENLNPCSTSLPKNAEK